MRAVVPWRDSRPAGPEEFDGADVFQHRASDGIEGTLQVDILGGEISGQLAGVGDGVRQRSQRGVNAVEDVGQVLFLDRQVLRGLAQAFDLPLGLLFSVGKALDFGLGLLGPDGGVPDFELALGHGLGEPPSLIGGQ